MHRVGLLVVLIGLVAACGARQEMERWSLRSEEECGQWPYGPLGESGTLILANGQKDDTLRAVRIEAGSGHSLACAVDLDGDDVHVVQLPVGVYYLRARWRSDYHESARHYFQIRDAELTLVNAYADGYQSDPLYDDTW